MGKLMVNLLQVVNQANTPTNSLTNGVVDRPCFFGVVGSNPTYISAIINIFYNKLLQTFPMSNLKNTLSGIPRK